MVIGGGYNVQSRHGRGGMRHSRSDPAMAAAMQVSGGCLLAGTLPWCMVPL